MSKSDVAFWLSLYASVVASATGLWALFRELWLERARIDVTTEESWLVRVKGQSRPLIVKGEKTIKTIGIPPSAMTPILVLDIRNRGRRDAMIATVSQLLPDGRSNVFGDLMPQLPFLIPAERTTQLVMGAQGSYAHGSLSLKRFYVVDGAGRIHPLRERHRQRLRRILPWRRAQLPDAAPLELGG